MDATELLERAGFTTNAYAYVRPGARHITVTDADTGAIPTAATTRFRAVGARPNGEGADLVLETDDVRDVVAFRIALANEDIVADGDYPPEDDCFSWDAGGTAVFNAFADDVFGDWIGERRADWPHNPDGQAVILAGRDGMPWLDDYVEWRDGTCLRLADPAPVPR